MADDLPPPPAGFPPPPGETAPPPPEVRRPGTHRLWFALLLAVTAAVGLVVVLAMLLGGDDPSPARGSVLFRDDFSEPPTSDRWLEAENEDGTMRYEGGAYRIAVTGRGELQSLASLASQQRGLRVAVDGAMLRGEGGFSVLCISELSGSPGQITELEDRGEYYDFFLSFADEAFAILSSTDLRAPLTAAGDAAGILQQGPVHVEIECVGAAGGEPAQLVLRVNGSQVLRYSDPGGTTSFVGVGLTVYSEGGAAEAEFDDLTVSSI